MDEAAEYLHVRPEDVRELVRRGEIPHRRMGERVVFRRREIDAWASQRILGFSQPRLEDYHRRASAQVRDFSGKRAVIGELLKPEFLEPALASRTKASLVRDMVELAERTGLVNCTEDLREALIAREQMCTTALAGGVAMLHPPHHEPYLFEDSFIVAARTVQPIPFGAPDGRTTDVFFLICCQDDRIHLHVLARICMMAHHTSLLLELREAPGAAAMYETLVASEEEVIRSL